MRFSGPKSYDLNLSMFYVLNKYDTIFVSRLLTRNCERSLIYSFLLRNRFLQIDYIFPDRSESLCVSAQLPGTVVSDT